MVREKADDRSAYDRAFEMLARREYSQRELRTRLKRAGCDEDESEAALRSLRQQHYQDDDRFAEMILHARVGQGYGPARIRAELRSHGLADTVIQGVLAGAEVDWQALAANQLRKKYGRKPPVDRADCARRAAFLQRRGFDAATVRIVTHPGAEFLDD